MIILSSCICRYSLLVLLVHIRWTVAFQTILFNKLPQTSLLSGRIVKPSICYNDNNINQINRNCRYNAIYNNRHDNTFTLPITLTKLSSTTTDSTTSTIIQDGKVIKKRVLTNEQKMIQILNKYEKIPYGELHENEEILLSKCWKALVSINNISDIDTKSQIGQRLLLRKIGDSTEFLRRQQSTQQKQQKELQSTVETASSTTSTTNVQSLSLNDFIIVLSIWEEYVEKHFINKNYEAISYALDCVMLLYTKLTNLYQEEIKYLDIQEVANTIVSTISIKPTIELYQLLFRIFEKSRERNIDKIAYRLLDEMKSIYTVEPTVNIFHSLIVMIAKSKEKNAANRAEQLLMDVIQKFPPSINSITNTIDGITIHSFNVVLTSWAKSSMSYGPERAEKLIAYIDTLDNGRNIIQPTVSSFTSLIDAYAQTNEWDSVSHSERIFNKVLDIHLNNNIANTETSATSTTNKSNSTNYDFEPSIVSWTILMNAYTSLSKRGHRGAAVRVNKLLNRMEVLYKDNRISFPPDAIVYITCINANAYSKTIEGAIAAETILQIMYNKYRNDNINNIDSNINTENMNNKYRPSIRCIKIIIEAYVKVCNIDGGENLLNTYYDNHIKILLESNENNNNPNWMYDVQDIYKTIIFGYCKNNNPIKAHTTLLDMIDHNISPDVYCFDRIIELNTQLMKSDNANNAAANTNAKIAMKRSYELFELLEECRVQNMVQPNERVYISFIRSMIKANIPRKAYKSRLLLRKMYKLYTDDTTNNSSIKPTVLTYNAILLACSESNNLAQQEQQQQQQNSEPSTESVEAFQIAVEIFNELTNNEKLPNGPDHVSFGNMLRCCNLLPNDDEGTTIQKKKDTIIISTFQLCCQYGLVNEFVLRDLQLIASTNLLQSMFGNAVVDSNNITLDDLPQSWTKNQQRFTVGTKTNPKRM